MTAKSATAAIALGTNLGEREANLREAIRRLKALGEVEAVSSFHDTEPEGVLDQPRFLNAAVLLRTALEPEELMRRLLAIENAMGRERVVPKGPRVIDLDLLLYEDGESRVMSTEELVLPHPAMGERRFVLDPLAEIAPEMRHPALKQTVSEMRSEQRKGREPRKD